MKNKFEKIIFMSPEMHGGQFRTRSKMMPIKIQFKN